MALPRHFVPRPHSASGAPPPAPPRHALDVFKLGNHHLATREYVVAAGVNGTLQLLDAQDHASLPANIQPQLSHHELARGAAPRALDAFEVHLFDVQLMEQPARSPGLNDPVYLYGTLYGPYPHGDTLAVQGQLTVTRADILAGLVECAVHAFHCGGSGDAPRTFHMLLPADRDEALHDGRGLVLAYPLPPAELLLDEASNNALVAQMLHDLLRALQTDLRDENVKHPLVDVVLPVPSRPALESELELDGYVIKGDTAVRRKSSPAGGVGGALLNMFGSLVADRMDLPPQGELDDFLRIARETLASLPGWPTPRHAVLRQRLRGTHVGNTSPRIPPPVRAPITPARPTPRVIPDPPARSGPPDWMQDFMQQHRGGGAPRVTQVTAAPFKGPATRRANRKDWMQDFAPLPDEKPAPRVEPEKTSAGKPEWMKDFE